MDCDNVSVTSSSSMTSDNYGLPTKYSSLQRNSSGYKKFETFQFNTLDGKRTRSKSSNNHVRNLHPRDGTISPEEADRKRSAFLQYLAQKYPQHSDIIAGKSFQQTQPAFGGIRTRASYAADCSYNSSPNDSEVTWHNSLSRGSRLRSSLPIVRSLSRSRERPLGTIYLEYSGECRTVRLPNEVTSLDTIRALFVQAYPGLLTMPMLDPQRHSILLKNRKTGNFDEIDNVSRIKDRSIIRTRPHGGSGIPLPGSKKPAVTPKPAAKPGKPVPGFERPKPVVTDDAKVVERNQKNLNKSGIKAPVKSLIRQYQSAPSLIKHAVTGYNESKPAQTTAEQQPKVKPPPPPRSTKPTAVAQTEEPGQGNYSPNGTLLTGNGMGGGSIPQRSFSYVKNGSDANQPNVTSPTQSRGLRSPTASRLSPLSVEKKHSSIPAPHSKPKVPLPPSKSAEPENSGKDNESRPKTTNTLQQATTKLPPTPFGATSPKNKALSKPFGMKHHATQNSRFGAKRNSPPTVTSTQLSTDTTTVYSNIKRTSSPERRATINGTGGSAGYCRGGRSFKGHQLKAVNIPSVPESSSSSCSDEQSKIESNSPSPEESQPVNIIETDDKSYAEMSPSPTIHPTLTNSCPSPDDGNDSAKGKAQGKKGLFGLRRLVSNRSKNQQNIPKRSQSEERPRNTDQGLDKPGQPSPSLSESLNSVRSSSPAIRSSTPVNRSSPLLSKHPVLPKTELLSSLLTTNANKDQPNDAILASSSDEDKDKPARHPVLAGVLKNNNLVKSTSSSSILSDSGASNASVTSSIRTKKVSFQHDVTVCDGNGISTFSNGLRQPASVSDVSFDRSMEQSLSTDAHDNTENEPKTWRAAPSSGYPTRPEHQQVAQRSRPATPHRYEPPPYQPSGLAYPSNSPRTHQSAVAAAIQSISWNAEPTPARYVPGQPENFSVSCASPVPVVTRQGNEASHKEEWNPLRRNAPEATAHAPSLAQRPCHTPVPTAPQKPAEVQLENEPSYFQTERVTDRISAASEAFKSDTPPYYECCETATLPSQAIPPSQLRDALRDQEEQYRHLTAESKNEENYPQLSSLPLTAPKSEGGVIKSGSDVTNKKVMAMERQLASLTGMVESIITSADGTQTSVAEPPYHQKPTHVGNSPQKSHSTQALMTSSEMIQQLIKLRETAHGLRDQMADLKRQQRVHMERVNDLVNEKSRDLVQIIASTAGAQHRPLRMRRFRLDRQRHDYSEDAKMTERMLSDVEAAVEELRNEVVERRCRVNAREVEALVLQLSQAGRTVAKLKGSYPALCDEIRTVGAGETEVIYAEEKFVEAEPLRLDEQLKRCKQLTATLFTLKKLATVQEARSKTPTSFGGPRPTTPSLLGARRSDDPNLRRRMLDEVRNTRVDHPRRMESIQDAEVSWTRRRKYNREYDSKKFEKALEVAEKALNRTNHISLVDQRRHNHLMELYKHDVITQTPRSNLTASDSSSIESLPPPPPPMDHMGTDFHPSYPAHLPPPPSDLNIHRPGPHDYAVVSPDVGYVSSDLSPEHRGLSHTGSLPRYHNHPRFHNSGHAPYVDYHHLGRQTPQPMVERSRSVTPHHWNQRPMTPQMFTGELSVGHELTEEQRRHFLEQQQMLNEEKNYKLKEQYSKLQQLQRKQRMAGKKYMNKPTYQHMPVAATAKSSDV